jgi:hypothetical protein
VINGVFEVLRSLPRALRLVFAAGVGVAIAGCAELGLDRALAGVLSGGSSEAMVVAGLREALQIGAERSVSRSARPGGFLDDPRLRIPLPRPLENVAKGLRALGFDGTVDELEVTMNRAAERSSREAQGLLVQAVASLTLQDANEILNGPDDAATRYLRTHSEAALRVRFSPVVEAAMREVGVYRAYDELRTRNRVLELLGNPTVELNRYVTDETLDGLFTLIRDEEGRIRNDPAARTTELLRSVFGQP